MSWYYAENNERLGPVEDAAFDALVASSTVRPDTLVWREGMTNWEPLSASGYRTPEAPLTPRVPGPAGGADEESARPPGVEMGVCSESGRILPRSELVEIDGKLVSVEYKNVVLQRIREGVGASGSAVDPEALAQQIIARDYALSIGSCVSRGWGIVKQNFWLCVGALLVVFLVVLASAITIIGPLFVIAPLAGGLYWINLRLHRKEPASIGDVFAGFSRNYWHLVGLHLIFGLTVFGLFVFLSAISFGFGITASASNAPSVTLMVIAGLLFFAGFLGMIYLLTSWVFSFPLVIDKQIDCLAAIKLSRRIVTMHWWRVFGVLVVPSLLLMVVMLGAGIILSIGGSIVAASVHDPNAVKSIIVIFVALFYCFYAVALLVMIPVTYSTIAAAYEDIFGVRSIS